MSFFKKVGKVLKKGLKYIAPVAAVAAPFIPGVGRAVSGAIDSIGGWLGGGSSAQAQTPPGPSAGANQGNQTVNITGQRPGIDWGGVASSVIPAFMGYLGQRQTNAANAQQAQQQMDFQREQTSTSYQRGVEDMQKAGLNPMLAYSQGGAASGGGAQATMGNEAQAGMSSAVQALMTRQQLAQMAAQVENIQADTSNKEQQTTNLQSENLYTLAKTATEGPRRHESEQRVAQLALDNALAAATQSSNIRLASSAADLRRAEAEREGYLAKASKYDLSRASAWSGFFDSSAGRAYPYGISAAEVANSAAGAVSKLNPFKFGAR